MNRVNVQSYVPSVHTYLGIQLLFPEDLEYDRRYPLLVLLHGRGKGRGQWEHMVYLEDLVDEKKIFVAMPQGNQSAFVNLMSGERWGDFLNRELPDLLSGWFPIRTEREGRGVLGVDTGGYGALRAVEGYALQGAVCPVCDLADLYETDYRPDPQVLFGPKEDLARNGYPVLSWKEARGSSCLREQMQAALRDVVKRGGEFGWY